jgi:hypothetical protein
MLAREKRWKLALIKKISAKEIMRKIVSGNFLASASGGETKTKEIHFSSTIKEKFSFELPQRVRLLLNPQWKHPLWFAIFLLLLSLYSTFFHSFVMFKIRSHLFPSSDAQHYSSLSLAHYYEKCNQFFMSFSACLFIKSAWLWAIYSRRTQQELLKDH